MSAIAELAGRRILFLNWRDLSNPAAGGAETYAEQVARLFARAGALITLHTSRYSGSALHDWANGYLVVRKGGRYGVYLAAARHLRRHQGSYDAVVDFQNGIPFFAPLWAPGMATVCVVHHVHQDQFSMYFRWPVSSVARRLESTVSRRTYRDCPLIAVSPSTRAEMHHRLGFRRQIHIVPNGLDYPAVSSVPRSPTPMIAVVTRLVPHKRLDLLVAAVPALLTRWPDLRVDIGGTGSAHADLLNQVKDLGLENTIALPGRIPEQIKGDLLSRAWLTVAPSMAEGWGLTVLEANAMGRPAVAFDVPGLRDSIRDGITGWLVPDGQNLAEVLTKAIAELADPLQQEFTAQECRRWAARFSWDATADRLARVLLSEIDRKEQGKRSQRDPVELATVAWWPADETGEIGQMIRKALRVTDVITSNEDGIKVIMTGCDEFGAAKALQRVPVPPTGLRLATTTELLCGGVEDDVK